MLHRPSAMKILVRAWRWVGFVYSGFKTTYAAATGKNMLSSQVQVETWPRTKTGQSDEHHVTNLVVWFAVEPVV
jgi:hypothetical protein